MARDETTGPERGRREAGEENRRDTERESEIPYRKADEEADYDERGEQGRDQRAPLRED